MIGEGLPTGSGSKTRRHGRAESRLSQKLNFKKKQKKCNGGGMASGPPEPYDVWKKDDYEYEYPVSTMAICDSGNAFVRQRKVVGN